MGRPSTIRGYNLLRTKHFHGVSSASPHAYSLKSRYGKVRLLVWPVYETRIIEVFDASLGQVGNHGLAVSDAGIQQHIEFRAGKLLGKSIACFCNDARCESDMLLTNADRK